VSASNSVKNNIRFLFLIIIFLAVTVGQAYAIVPSGYSEYYIPGDEESMDFILDEISLYDLQGDGVTPDYLDIMHCIISVTAWSENTTLYYDHWEDGYDFDPADLSTADETYSFGTAGVNRKFEGSYIPAAPRNSVNVYYDGGDRLYVAGGTVTVTRTSWNDTNPTDYPGHTIASTLLAVAWEIYPVRPQLIKYILPFGEDLAAGAQNLQDFERVFALIQATQDNTVLQVDVNKDGTYDSLDWDRNGTVDGTSTILSKGEVFLLDRLSIGDQVIDYPGTITDAIADGSTADNLLIAGTEILGSETLQVHYVIGDGDSNYEIRGLTAFPRGLWDDEYYAQVDGPAASDDPVDLYLYNPHSTTLNMTYETTTGNGAFTIPAESTRSFHAATGSYMPENSAVYLKGSDVFWGVSTVDTSANDNGTDAGETHDWAYSLVPASLLENEHYIGWAPGSYPTATGVAADNSGIYLTPARDNTTIFVDYASDGFRTADGDTSYPLDRLESQYIYDSSDGDMSNANIYGTGPYSAAYGQNPDTAPTGSPAIDVGYTTIPGVDFIDLVLTVDKTVSPAVIDVASGSSTTFTLSVRSHDYSVTGISIIDTLPENWNYDDTLDTAIITLADKTVVTTDPTESVNADGDEVLTWDSSVLGSMAANQEITIVITARTTAAFSVGDLSRNDVTAVGTRTVQGITQTFNTSDFEFVGYQDGASDFTMNKLTGVVDPLSPGDTYTYTINMQNTGTGTLTGVSIYDPLPPGISYVDSSSLLTLFLTDNVRDSFSSVAYSNNDGSENWGGDWSETDTLGGDAASGLVQVTGSQLQFAYYSASPDVRDEFETVAYDNQDGTGVWSSEWTETDVLGGDAASGTVSVVSGADGQLQFANAVNSFYAADNFEAASYDNNDGSVNWSGDWTETDGYGENDDSGASGGFVRGNGSELAFTYLLSTVGDDFETSGSYSEDDGSDDWTTSWTENDTSGPTGGYIEVEDDRLEFQSNASSGLWVERTANILGATSVSVSLYHDNRSLDSGHDNDRVVVEYEIDGSDSWNEILTLDDDPDDTYGDTFTWDPTDTTITLRIRLLDGLENNEEARFNWVQIEYNKPVDASTTQIIRSVVLSSASAATLSFDYDSSNLATGDIVVVQASSDGSSFTPLATYDGAVSGTASFDLDSPVNYMSANTTIRFLVTSGFETINKSFTIDSVRIDYDVSVSANGSDIVRSVDLSSATSATLDFDYSATALGVGDTVDVDVYDGSSWTTLGTYDGSTASFDIAPPYNILSYKASDTAVRFTVTSGFDSAGKTFYMDDVNIAYDEGSAASGASINRAVDLSDATSAILTFDYSTVNLASGDKVIVEASADGVSFTTLASYDGAVSGSASLNLISPTDYAAAGTIIRFTVDSGLDDTAESFSIDNMDISFDWTPSYAANNPPNIVSSGDGYELDSGESLTLTFNVTVDDPLATGITEITNTADVLTNEIPIPKSDSVTNIVSNPSSATGEVGDLVWFDVDGDGVKDVGENGLANVEVSLKDEFGDTKAVDTTDGSGEYRFTGVTPGNNYYVEVTDGVPAGLSQSAPSGHTDDKTDAFNLTAGQVKLDANFGYTSAPGTGTLGDFVWSDADSDGFQDGGEPGLAGVTVELWQDTNSNGVFDSGTDTQLTTTLTAADGSYLFTGVTAGDYLVYVDGAQGGSLTGYSHTTSPVTVFTGLSAGDVVLNNDFGFVNTSTYSIMDRVWYDVDKDGDDDNLTTTDNGETGISGVTVDLLDASLNVIASTITIADGFFQFNGIAGGGADYTVRITDNNSKLTDYFGITTEAIAGEMAINNLSGDLDYTTEPSEPNFGYSVSGAIGDTVFNDVDGDTIQDAGELGINGVTVNLYLDDGDGIRNGADTSAGTLTTDANGNYLFSGLANGTYFVDMDPTQAALSSYDSRTTADDEAAVGDQREVLINDDSHLDIDFGYQASTQGSVTGTLWKDDDAYGVIDAGETFFSGVTMELKNSGGSTIATATTDGSGDYSFTGIPILSPTAETYTVVITDDTGVLNGYSATYENDSTLDAKQDVTPDTGTEDISGINFGFKDPVVTRAVIGDFGAFDEGGKMVVRWQTVSEHGTLGFYLYRLNTNTGQYTAINNKLLPGLLHAQAGGSYSYEDNGAKTGTYYTYRLEEVEASGKHITYGPWLVYTGIVPAGEDAVVKLNTHAAIAGFKSAKKSLPDAKIVRLEAKMAARFEAYAKKLARKGVQAKIYVKEDGLYFITAEDIATVLDISLKKITNQIKFNNVRLRCMGQKVAVLPATDNSGVYFYGEKRETRYSDENVYWLDIHKGLKMKTVNRVPKTAAPDLQYFYPWVWEEEDHYPLVTVFSNPENDFWMWDFVMPGFGYDQVFVTISTSGIVDVDTATLTVALQGASDAFDGNDHHAVIRVNGVEVGEARWDGFDSTLISVPVAPAILNDGDNQVEVAGIQAAGVPYDIFYLNNLQIVYPRSYTSVDNQLTAENNGYQTMRMDGFTDADIRVFDITDARRPLSLAKTVIEASETGGGDLQVRFNAGTVFRRYLAITPERVKPCTLIADQPSYLKKRFNLGDYLIITSSDMVVAAQTLADYRSSQGRHAMVVDVEDIYDEFLYGVRDADAIREFFAYAYSKWRIPPQYVFFAGVGSFDYKDNMGFSDSIIPPLVSGTPDGLIVTDAPYADVAGNDWIPEFAIGRIPVVSADELLEYINKVIGYETSSGAWTRQAILAADAPDTGGDFTTSSEDVASLFPADYLLDRLYMDVMPIEVAQANLVTDINAGRAYMNFIGHGGPKQIGNHNLLSTDDLSQLHNGMLLPVITAMTCAAGNFGYPGLDGFNESLALKADGGAVAVWAPSGFTFNSESEKLCKGFYSAVFIGGETVLGDAIRRSQEAFANRGEKLYHIDLYNLMGDPALILK